MREIQISIPIDVSERKTIATIVAALEASQLLVATRGTLKTYPGSTHWHLKNGNQRGTLELTWWPVKRKLWFKIQAGRSADWIDQAVRQLTAAIEMRLRSGRKL